MVEMISRSVYTRMIRRYYLQVDEQYILPVILLDQSLVSTVYTALMLARFSKALPRLHHIGDPQCSA